jgi:3' terminal RNA ribose 2'-O-methyltransferase Hen1
MLLTISTTHQPATDLGFLLHKNPDRVQRFRLSFGEAHVFYPEASTERCTAALLLDVDPIGLVRGRPGAGGEGGLLMQYVNDRPYVASSFLSVAIADVFGTAMSGRSKERSELAGRAIPLHVRIAAVGSTSEHLLRKLFEPLGYRMLVERQLLDPAFAEWGYSRYFAIELIADTRLSEVLSHLYVLLPVLDDQKHYWVGDAEVEKLLRVGSQWLASHPERDLITRRYLKHYRSLVREAITRLLASEEAADDAEAPLRSDAEEGTLELPMSLNEQRLATVLGALRSRGAKSVVDLGCGEGRLLRLLLEDRAFERVVGMDVSYRALETAAERLHLERMPPKQRERVQLLHGSLLYRDARLNGFDAATAVEVIEHLDHARRAAFERVVFEFARPTSIIITTPNAEYNVRWPSLPAGRFRHRDHRFEWTRAQFEEWAVRVGERFAYAVHFAPIGAMDPDVGSPTQMAVFDRAVT